MIRKLKALLIASITVFAGSAVLWSCESDADNLGAQFFNGADGATQSYDVVAYNVSNNDSVRSDAQKLTSAVVGAFSESQFGGQKASYVTQVRMASYAPSFGTNAVLDSVVLMIKPTYASDTVTTTTKSITYSDAASTQVVNTYPMVKYGKTKSSMTLNVHEVTDFLGGSADTAYSNKSVGYGTLIGKKTLNGTVNSVKITKTSDNTELLSREASIRIPLDTDFFQSKIIAKSTSTELADASNFIRYFKGLRISVAEGDGYMFNFTPNDLTMIMYYKYDSTSNGTTTRASGTFSFDLGSANAHIGLVSYDRTGAAVASAGYNSTTGDKKLYTQGMGGPGFGVKIPAATITAIRDLYQKQSIAILSAKIRVYTDTESWNNNYTKPSSFVVKLKDSTAFTPDVTSLSSNSNFSLVKGNNLTSNPAYYDITVTQTLKNIIEKAAANTDIILNVGSYEISSSTSALLGQSYTSRAYTPNRVVLVGTDSANENKAQLKIVYTKK